MRDIIGDLAHAGHQPLNLIKHAVKVCRELVEFVIRPAARHSVRQVAGDHALGRAVDLLDPAQHVAAHHGATQQPDPQRDETRPQQRRLDAIAESRGIADIPTNQ